MKSSRSLHRLTQAGLIAALYAVLTLIISPIGFGPVQLRLSEALTVLPVFTPAAIPGLTVGCILSNAVGIAIGANTAGVLDILFGSAATLLAALCSYALRNIRLFGFPVLSTIPPVLFNAVIIGMELSITVLGGLTWDGFALMALDVGLGQLAACIVGGLILFAALDKTGAAKKLFSGNAQSRS